RIEAQGYRPYDIPVGGSYALGALGYVVSALEISQQCEDAVAISSVVVASGSAGTHAGVAVGLIAVGEGDRRRADTFRV
ncbi:hypothetical protein Q6246_29310, partial [Klebsiella pneumoniae]|nr:hypothetical protein [Klebsiella pneumoniae]